MPPSGGVRLPCLAFNSGKYSDAPILFSLSERRSVPSNMEELRGSTTWATPHGWFLVRRQTTFLWNPSNGDKIQLPPLHEDVRADCTCLLSDKPAAACCVVLLLEMMGPVLWFGPAPAFSSIAMREVVTDGYGVAHSALVFMVESNEGQQLHMVNLLFEGSFSSVVYEVGVYRMDLHEWRRVYDLEGHAFLISSPNFCASRRADECGLEEDCVYVAYPWDKGLMIYNIRDGTMKVEDLEEAPESGAGRPLWMLPAC